MIHYYYSRICHLRIAQPIINDINLILSSIYDFKTGQAINVVSYISLKYQKELDRIAFIVSGRPVIKGNHIDLYMNYPTENLMADLEYLVDCLVVIGSVRYGVEKSIDDAIKRINESE